MPAAARAPDWEPPFRVTDKPWFLTRRRAKATLAARSHVLPPRDAIARLRTILGTDFESVQELLFSDFTHRQDGFRYTLLVAWMFSSVQARDALFDLADRVVEETGWYPVVQGERLRSSLSYQDFLHDHRRPQRTPQLGHLISLENAVSSEGGCALRLRTSAGALLLDTGLPGCLEPAPDDVSALLTHTHRDHSGGLDAATESGMSLAMAEPTAYVLRELGWVASDRLLCVRLIRPEERVKMGALDITPFPVPHAPGAVGYEITDGATTVIYTGDLSLQSARHDFLPTLVDRVRRAQGVTWVVLDATMAGRAMGASLASPADVVLAAADNFTDVIVTARDAEVLLYAYLDTYRRMTDRPVEEGRFRCLVDSRLRPVFRLLHAGAARRAFDEIDPFMLAQYGQRSLSWGESAWLYWLDGRSTNLPGPRLWFVPHGSLSRVGAGEAPAIVHVGRGELPDLDFPATALVADTSPWTLHSSDVVLRRATQELAPLASVALFHNFSGRLRRFIRDAGADADAVAVSAAPIPLR